MKTLCFTFVFVAAAMASVILPKHESKSGAMSPITHQPIGGEIDGKIYYVENEFMPWQEALQYCHGLDENMDLATITTRAQMDFLIQAYNNEAFSGDFWTSGRDARGPRQYTWNHTGEMPDSVINFASSPWYQTCLVIRSVPNNSSKLHGVHCEKMQLRPLCELSLF